MPRKAISITEALKLFPDFKPTWKAHHPGCPDPESVALGNPKYGAGRHLVVVETNTKGLPLKPLWDQIAIEENFERDTPGAIAVPYCYLEGVVHVVLCSQYREVRGILSLEFPQGWVHPNESITDCACREVLEEVDLRPVSAIELPATCAVPDWLMKDNRVVAVNVDPNEVLSKRQTLHLARIDDLRFTDQINAGSSLAAWLRFMSWLSRKRKHSNSP